MDHPEIHTRKMTFRDEELPLETPGIPTDPESKDDQGV